MILPTSTKILYMNLNRYKYRVSMINAKIKKYYLEL